MVFVSIPRFPLRGSQLVPGIGLSDLVHRVLIGKRQVSRHDITLGFYAINLT